MKYFRAKDAKKWWCCWGKIYQQPQTDMFKIDRWLNHDHSEWGRLRELVGKKGLGRNDETKWSWVLRSVCNYLVSRHSGSALEYARQSHFRNPHRKAVEYIMLTREVLLVLKQTTRTLMIICCASFGIKVGRKVQLFLKFMVWNQWKQRKEAVK